MLTVADQLRIRQAYYHEKKSQREIAREWGLSRNTVKKALEQDEPFAYRRKQPARAPVIGPYRERLGELVEANQGLPRKQRYTAHKMYEIIRGEGYTGAESTVRYQVAQLRKATRQQAVYLPLEYDPGVDAQMDWGTAEVELGGQRVTVKQFTLRWCYSRKLFVAAYPSEKQECFLDGHVRAFHYFGGLPQRITYDNLKPAVLRILEGRNREEQARFLAFRNHYVFDSRYCPPPPGMKKAAWRTTWATRGATFWPDARPLPISTRSTPICWSSASRRMSGRSMASPTAWPPPGTSSGRRCARCRRMTWRAVPRTN